jgi:predicted metalloprotease with PDZ domain
MSQQTTRIHVSFPRPENHLLHLECRFLDLHAGEHDFFMPVWTPGSYMVREYPRHVEGLEARDGEGHSLEIIKTRKNRWSLQLPEASSVTLFYRVYAHDLTVRTNFLDEKRAYWNGAASYIVHEDYTNMSFHVAVDRPDSWDVFTGLSSEGDHWVARDFDELMDCPFVVGDIPSTHFEAHGVPHVVMHDGVDTEERERLNVDLQRIVTSAGEVFGGKLPYGSYVFQIFADETASGGLEHANSTVLHVRRSIFRRPQERMRLLDLCAHEHFHSWNVKRIRPAGLASFDYENENYTRDLWLAEGFTTYYQEVIPYMAGLFGRDFFLERLAENHAQVEAVPGRKLMSLSESSFDAWIKLYRPDENTRNSTVSYYGKGAVLALCLDLMIQAHSEGQRSLDDVMRGLYADYLERGSGQSRDLVLRLANEAAGTDLGAEFALLVDGRGDMDLQPLLEPFGLSYEGPSEPAKASLDIRVQTKSGRLIVASVDRDGAGDRMGLSAGDEIIALGGERVSPDGFDACLAQECLPKQEVTLLVFRRGIETRLRGRLSGRSGGKARIHESGKGRLCFRPLS